jgi:hypothetical protein
MAFCRPMRAATAGGLQNSAIVPSSFTDAGCQRAVAQSVLGAADGGAAFFGDAALPITVRGQFDRAFGQTVHRRPLCG